jgi:hypothetical protein
MKTSRLFLMLLAAAVGTTACEKNGLPDISGPQTGGAAVKFFNFSVGSPNVNFYINNAKVTGVSSSTCAVLTDANRQQCTTTGAEATTGVAYGSAGNGASAWYSDAAPGQISIAGKIAAATDKNLAIANLSTTIAAQKFYSFYLSGIYDPGTKTTDAFLVEDVMPPQNFNVAYVRFVNASSTTQPLVLYAKDKTSGVEVALGSAVAYKSAGAFVALPWNAAYDLSARPAGSATAVLTRATVSFSSGGIYTITLRGNTATSSTMALDNTRNQ